MELFFFFGSTYIVNFSITSVEFCTRESFEKFDFANFFLERL